jgi:hypothetical protein
MPSHTKLVHLLFPILPDSLPIVDPSYRLMDTALSGGISYVQRKHTTEERLENHFYQKFSSR